MTALFQILASNGALAAAGAAAFIIPLLIFLLMVAGLWKMFQKAGEPGWAAIIPIYNMYIALKIIGRPVWWLILFFIPVVNFIVGIIVTIDLAKAYGQGIGYAIGMLILPIIFYPLLGFGSATYQGAPN